MPRYYEILNNKILIKTFFNKKPNYIFYDIISNYVSKFSFSQTGKNNYEKSLFNHRLDNLSLKLLNLELGYSFNKLLNHLPEKLMILCTGSKFNKNLSYLPNSITNIRLKDRYNQELNNLPNQLQEIQFPMLLDKKKVKIAPHNTSKIIIKTKALNVICAKKGKRIIW